ncbi:hypothetical protein M1N85_05230, partial [Dehalococcoidia bacterium]|nr:hypothetical protein [Dehalococcoidia bacterium]
NSGLCDTREMTYYSMLSFRLVAKRRKAGRSWSNQMDRLKAEVRRLKLNHPAYFMPKSLQSSVYLPDGSG